MYLRASPLSHRPCPLAGCKQRGGCSLGRGRGPCGRRKRARLLACADARVLRRAGPAKSLAASCAAPIASRRRRRRGVRRGPAKRRRRTDSLAPPTRCWREELRVKRELGRGRFAEPTGRRGGGALLSESARAAQPATRDDPFSPPCAPRPFNTPGGTDRTTERARMLPASPAYGEGADQADARASARLIPRGAGLWRPGLLWWRAAVSGPASGPKPCFGAISGPVHRARNPVSGPIRALKAQGPKPRARNPVSGPVLSVLRSRKGFKGGLVCAIFSPGSTTARWKELAAEAVAWVAVRFLLNKTKLSRALNSSRMVMTSCAATTFARHCQLYLGYIWIWHW